MLSFTYVENRGAAFGMMTGKQIFLIVVTIVALIYLIYKYYKDVRKSKDKLLKAGFILIISGAIGNLIDRIFLGYVIDFIKLEFIDFPVFNFADIYVSIGCIIISFYILFKHEEE